MARKPRTNDPHEKTQFGVTRSELAQQCLAFLRSEGVITDGEARAVQMRIFEWPSALAERGQEYQEKFYHVCKGGDGA